MNTTQDELNAAQEQKKPKQKTAKEKWAEIVAKIEALGVTPEDRVKVTDLASGYFASHDGNEPNLVALAAHVKKAVLPPSVQK